MGQGLTRDRVLEILQLTRHQFYYIPKAGRRGRKKSSVVFRRVDDEHTECTNEDVVAEISRIQLDPDTDYGYRKMTIQLMLLGFVINHKKVYRLMKKALLLKARQKATGKTYIKYRIVTPEGPLEVLEMDIKQVWITRERRYAYILTIIDTFTRAVLHWSVGFSMRKSQIKQAWEAVITEHLQAADQLSKGVHVELRNDNGPQFSAAEIRGFFKENHINQVFTHPYTPQENGHVESFHSILKHALEGHTFWSLDELEERLNVFYYKYNNVRLHSSIAYLWPMKFWELWNEGKVIRIEKAKKRVKFKLSIPYQEISGNGSRREVSCSNTSPLNEGENLQKEVNGPNTPSYTTSVQRSPSVVSC
ncbi:IS3 family transposase [Cytophagaceae bacterium ABcell3]|nr:IS3 family transposase [Cytophagaceae bacterium ABcell3]WMJ75671.1 IS3 family transposase [Cytophagaceae bacterium ABcell3]